MARALGVRQHIKAPRQHVSVALELRLRQHTLTLLHVSPRRTMQGKRGPAHNLDPCTFFKSGDHVDSTKQKIHCPSIKEGEYSLYKVYA